MSKNLSAVCFGEVLWDVFPDHKKIGGAPLNVALRMQSLGVQTAIISRIGNDKLGHEIEHFAAENGLDTSNIQIDNAFKTGVVDVKLDEKGSATYSIVHPVAWDKIVPTKETVKIVKNADAFIFGSLVSRDAVSRDTLLQLLPHAKFKIFDVNLRPPHYNMNGLIKMMQIADFIKCNDEELETICKALEIEANKMEEKMRLLSKVTSTNQICVTRGGDGAALLSGDIFYQHPGFKVKVKDTVGAGDSFLASLIFKLLTNTQKNEALTFACAIGSLVASKSGANPKIELIEVEQLQKKT